MLMGIGLGDKIGFTGLDKVGITTAAKSFGRISPQDEKGGHEVFKRRLLGQLS